MSDDEATENREGSHEITESKQVGPFKKLVIIFLVVTTLMAATLVIGVYTNRPEAATALSLLGALFEKADAYGAAEPFYSRALSIREEVPGRNGIPLVFAKVTLARIYIAQERYAEAENALRSAIESLNEHPRTAQHSFLKSFYFNELAGTLRAQQKYDLEREARLQRLAILEEKFPHDIEKAAKCLEDISATYIAQGNNEEAELYAGRAKKKREETPEGGLSTNTVINLEQLVRTQKELQNNADSAEVQ
jgi:tetratricopeptide (TPR) repeat protein